MKYSILIMTFYKRFDEWFKPLIIEIKRQRPDIEIVVAINGELDYFNEDYRKSILDFLKDYKNVFPVVYPRFRSFARMCNLGVQFSTEENILILSDDLSLEDGFFNTYEHVLESHQIFAINMSFSAISITKRALMNMGWFDERLLGMGWEDGDLMEKYIKYKNGEKFPNTVIESCKNITEPKFYKVHNEKLMQYMKTENRLEGQKLDGEFGRYSQFNKDVYDAKFPSVNQYPLESFYLDNKDKLK